MPYVNFKITREGATAEQKALLIQGATDLLVNVLGKTLRPQLLLLMKSRPITGALVERRLRVDAKPVSEVCSEKPVL